MRQMLLFSVPQPVVADLQIMVPWTATEAGVVLEIMHSDIYIFDMECCSYNDAGGVMLVEVWKSVWFWM